MDQSGGALLTSLALLASSSASQTAGVPSAASPELEQAIQILDFVWVMVAAALVMVMQIGFLLLEAGMVRSKNSINVAMKNVLDFAASALFFALTGFMIAFGPERLDHTPVKVRVVSWRT